MFKIITPIVLAVLAVTASKEGSNDITRRLLGEDYNNIDGVTQGGQEGNVDVAGRDNGMKSRSPPYSPHIDSSRVLGVKNDEKVDGPLMMKAQDVDDDNRDNGFMMMAQNGDDNGLESRHGGYVRRNDYFKRDYYDKPYYPRYRSTEGGESDPAAFSMMMANEGGNPDDGAARFALMDGEAGDDNRIAVASRYGGYRRNNNYGYNGYRRNYYKNNGYGPYWANEGGDNEMDSFNFPPYARTALANQGGKPIDDDAAQGVFMANEGGNPEMDSFSFPDILPARYGRYGPNDYYRNNNRYDRYYRNGRNDYHDGYDRQYRNRYNNDDRYRANEGGNNEEPDAFSMMMANEGGNPDDTASPWAMMDGVAEDNNRIALGSRHGGYRRNDYGYKGYRRNVGNNYYRNRYNDGYGYRANERGMNEGGESKYFACPPWGCRYD